MARHVAVAIPVFNEADGIAEFLLEIDQSLSPVVDRLTLVVVDDASTDATVRIVTELEDKLAAELVVERCPSNRGHGPTVRDAYDRALATGAEIVLQVDGDGQFLGADLRRLLVLLDDGARAVCGVRRFRQDPWFRMIMTRAVRTYVGVGFGVPTRDANCPLRGYHAEVLGPLLREVPAGAMVPNLYLTIIAARRGTTMVEVDVTHRVRRGTSAVGSTWRQRRTLPVPWHLVRFSIDALKESIAFRRTL
jgi:glycosyltransferase involved in cell wall biosynthesis